MFIYANLYRLIFASGIYGAITYTYDKVGNRLSRTQNSDEDTYHYYPATNLLNIVAGKHPEQILYDSDGNTTQRIPGATNPAPGVTDPADYFYNSGGQRVKKDNSVDKVFHYDLAGQLIAETDATGAIIKAYVWLHGEPLAQIAADGAVYYYHKDHLGTPQKMTDASGVEVWAADYLPFGRADVTIGTVENHLRFAGQYFDEETGLHYNYHRYYDPGTGRYLTPDPIGLEGGINLFLYANGNPINLIDPLGLIWVTVDVDYHGVSNWSRGILKFIGELIEEGQLVLPGDESFVGATREITQRWEPDPDNPCEDSRYPYGTLRIFDQTYMKHMRGPNDLTDNFPEPYYYQWHPYVPARTYTDVPGARIIDRTPYIQNPR